MTAPIEDVGSLPGKKISDQAENPIGKVKEIFATDDGYPMWVAVELYGGIGEKRIAPMPRSSPSSPVRPRGSRTRASSRPATPTPGPRRPGRVCAIRGSSEMRKVTAEDIAHHTQRDDGSDREDS